MLLFRKLPPVGNRGVVYESEAMGRPADFDLIVNVSIGLAIVLGVIAAILYAVFFAFDRRRRRPVDRG
ncbi:MAG: hypothetical protein ACR2NZ_05495 [Rubripirellula sp.]